MCRFNLILVKEKEAEEILLREGYEKVFDELMDYMAFRKGYCNCGSFVGSMRDKKVLKSEYLEVAENCKEEELKHLYQIRDFMIQPGYRKKKQIFEKQRMRYLEELDSFQNHIVEYELEQLEVIEQKYSGEEYNQRVDDLYEKLDELQTEVENNPAYQVKKNKYLEFLNNNKLMDDSSCYYLNEEEEEESRSEGLSLKELFGDEFQMLDEDTTEEILEVEEPSMVIAKVIERQEKNKFENEIQEYNSYFEEFSKLLKKVESFFFTTIWSNPNQLNKVKKVDINSLKIDDLAFLEYDEMLCITR